MSIRKILPAISLVLASCAIAPAHATTAVVPDSFPTIQAGIDSGRDTVLVRGGRYEENLTSNRGLALLTYPPTSYYGDPALPQVGSLTVAADDSWPLLVRGFRFRGKVQVSGFRTIATFETCRMDSGLSSIPGPFLMRLNVSGCTILGGVSFDYVMQANITLNSVYGGGITVYSEGSGTIQGNYVHGPAPFGIKNSNHDGSSYIEGNTVVATETGITSWAAWVADNEVLDCTGSAFLGGLYGTYERNKVARCGGYAFDFVEGRNGFTVRHNEVVDCAKGGVRSTGTCAADSNVVGHCGGPGFDIDDGLLRGNTSYLNQGAGYTLRGEVLSVANNIAYGNSGPGLLWTGSSTPTLACNDWFANTGGATSGALPGPADLAVDPLFCDASADDVHLSAGSPLLDASGCGLIGALRQGCAGVPTPALLSLVSVEAGADGIKLTWLAGKSVGGVATVYRSSVGGEWTRIGEVTADGTGYLRYTDPIDGAATRVGYRLGMVEAGVETFYGETWVDVPAHDAALAFALEGVRPNPSRGEGLTVAFTLPTAASARLELLDVSGRRVAEREVGSLGAGPHALDLSEGRRLTPGLYLLRLTQGTNTRVTRVAVLK